MKLLEGANNSWVNIVKENNCVSAEFSPPFIFLPVKALFFSTPKNANQKKKRPRLSLLFFGKRSERTDENLFGVVANTITAHDAQTSCRPPRPSQRRERVFKSKQHLSARARGPSTRHLVYATCQKAATISFEHQ